MKWLNVVGAAGALIFLSSCVSTGRLVSKKEIPKKSLNKYEQGCVHVTAVKAHDVEAPNLLALTIERLRDKKAFKTVEACGEKVKPKVLRIDLHISKITEGNAFLAGMGWGGHTEMVYDAKFSAGKEVISEFVGTANSKQKFTWGGNRWGNLTQKTLANAAAEVTFVITKNKAGEEY